MYKLLKAKPPWKKIDMERLINYPVLIKCLHFSVLGMIRTTEKINAGLMAPHSNTLAWKIQWTEEPSRLQSMGSLRGRHDWVTSLSLFTFMHWRGKWQHTPLFFPGESQGRSIWWAAIYGVAQSWTWLKWLSSSSSIHIFGLPWWLRW